MHSGECAFSSLCKTIELTKTVKKSIFILKCAVAHRNCEAKKQNVQLEALLAKYWKLNEIGKLLNIYHYRCGPSNSLPNSANKLPNTAGVYMG